MLSISTIAGIFLAGLAAAAALALRLLRIGKAAGTAEQQAEERTRQLEAEHAARASEEAATAAYRRLGSDIAAMPDDELRAHLARYTAAPDSEQSLRLSRLAADANRARPAGDEPGPR